MIKRISFPLFLTLFFTLYGAQEPAASPSPASEQAQEEKKTEEPAMTDEMMPAKSDLPSYEGAFVKMLIVLGGLIVLIFLTVWIMRKLSQGRFGGGFGSRTIRVLERRALSPKSVLYLVEIGDKKVVISESQLEVRRVTTLHEVVHPDEE